jgi:hypothetical protein
LKEYQWHLINMKRNESLDSYRLWTIISGCN